MAIIVMQRRSNSINTKCCCRAQGSHWQLATSNLQPATSNQQHTIQLAGNLLLCLEKAPCALLLWLILIAEH